MLARHSLLQTFNQHNYRFWLKTSFVLFSLLWVSGFALAQFQQLEETSANTSVAPVTSISTSERQSSASRPAIPSLQSIDVPSVVDYTTDDLVENPFEIETQDTAEAVGQQMKVTVTTDFVADNVVSLDSTPQNTTISSDAFNHPVPSPLRPPVFVTINNDVITFEFSEQIARQQTQMMRALARAMLTDQLFQEQQWLSTQPLNLQARPTLYRRVLDHRQETVTTPIQAHAYAQFLIQRRLEWGERQGQRVAQIRIPLTQSNLPLVAQPYEPYVLRYASEFKVSPALVFAVMEVESNFNPRAVSRSNALGLMQIKDYAAGRDVLQKIDGIDQMPSRNTLFNPEQNIRIGTAYLGLLYHDYFAAVNDPNTRSALVIAAYNGGLNRVWPLFGRDMETAMQQVNRLSTAQVKQRISQQHPSAETRNYLTKVLNTQAHYQAWLGRDAQPLLALR
jgi:membrane-bound lytic murein transglycosylase C